MNATRIAGLRWRALRVSPKTVWSFVEATDGAGRTGVGEATLGGREAEMAQSLDALRTGIVQRGPQEVDLAQARATARSRAQFAVISALDQALRDLAARQRGLTVAQALGGARRQTIALYANINRGIAQRTPEGFAAHARAAVADGFTAIKIAPFDGVELYGDAGKPAPSASIDAALARIAAVRVAIGPERDLMVDCHWRLNRATAEAVLRAAEPYRLYWLECPVPETPQHAGTIRALRELANARGVRLAGCEEMSLEPAFRPFYGCYDVMMPDVKYVGGMDEMLRVADALHGQGIGFSPHNPSGPVCHAASLQVCAVAAHVERLEMQYAETPLFDALVAHALPTPVGGSIPVPRTPGLGVSLDPAVAAQLETPQR